jgi:hypothetical protein
MLFRVSDALYPANDAPDPIGCNAVAVEHVMASFKMVYQKPCFIQYPTSRYSMPAETASPTVKKAWARKNQERKLFQELSQYYERGKGSGSAESY